MPGFWVYASRDERQTPFVALSKQEPALTESGRWDLIGAPYVSLDAEPGAEIVQIGAPTANLADTPTPPDWDE